MARVGMEHGRSRTTAKARPLAEESLFELLAKGELAVPRKPPRAGPDRRRPRPPNPDTIAEPVREPLPDVLNASSSTSRSTAGRATPGDGTLVAAESKSLAASSKAPTRPLSLGLSRGGRLVHGHPAEERLAPAPPSRSPLARSQRESPAARLPAATAALLARSQHVIAQVETRLSLAARPVRRVRLTCRFPKYRVPPPQSFLSNCSRILYVLQETPSRRDGEPSDSDPRYPSASSDGSDDSNDDEAPPLQGAWAAHDPARVKKNSLGDLMAHVEEVRGHVLSQLVVVPAEAPRLGLLPSPPT
ncbi:hypothetical protein DIPPA_20481 [Diplonema papillatum]|nr:hypothetical protein DIPPA_20481 [Diplonema papillatum]